MINARTRLSDLAFVVYKALKASGVDAVLSGGAVVSVYSKNKYESRDLDFISADDNESIDKAMDKIGFVRHGKNFIHPKTKFTVEFPSGPLAIGNELIKTPKESVVNGKRIKILSPTDAIKDRLAGYFYFKDPQNLEQAKLLYREVGGNLSKVRAWAVAEGELEKYEIFIRSLNRKRMT